MGRVADDRTILIVGTWDTKDDELDYVARVVEGQGGRVVTMDVGVLGEPSGGRAITWTKHDVAAAAGSTIGAVISAGDENAAMQVMARGAATLAARSLSVGRFDGVLLLGGSMGTDLALDVCRALPLGVPKLVVSTVAFSPLIPPERLAPDVQMMSWAGGLYGLNPICRATLSQAAGSVLGAARAVEPARGTRPLVGMTSLGSSALTYMKRLKPALDERGYDLAVFHATGMGGLAFESLATAGAFACVLDLCTQELGNHVHGSRVSSGPDRLTAAGRAGVPQIVAPGCHDLVDLPAWQPLPAAFERLDFHDHNRLIRSVVLDADGRRAVARAHAERLAAAVGPTALLLPLGGTGEWDRPGEALHRPADLAAFVDAMRAAVDGAASGAVELVEIDAHINDAAFSDAVLAVFDRWRAAGACPASA